jgi:hypothetical protein
MMNCPLNIYLLCQFAMGLNMPAKTVVFTAVKKWDGDSHRYIGSGEYIQVSDNLLHFSRALKNIRTHKCLCIYMCVCVCVCVLLVSDSTNFYR